MKPNQRNMSIIGGVAGSTLHKTESLLPRETICLNDSIISESINSKVVLITGGGGSIGSELCRQIAKFMPKKIVIFDIYENNAYELQNELSCCFPKLDVEIFIGSIRDAERLNSVFAQTRPGIVFHAAAYKHVPLMESNPAEAVMNNVFGTINTANCAKMHHAEKFILLSTDKAVNAKNVMGATKRACEMAIQLMGCGSSTTFAAVRFGNVLGSSGSVVNLFKMQIKSGGPVTLTHKDVTRYFMTVTEAAQLVLEAASYAKDGKIYVLDMGNPVKIYDLAVNMILLEGLQPYKDIDIEVKGLRPGEKLHEELSMQEETLTATENKKIYVVKPVGISKDKFEKGTDNLLNAAQSQDADKIKRALADLVETYTPNIDSI